MTSRLSDFQCHVISLERTPERLEAFLRDNGATGLDFRPFAGVDGHTLKPEEAVAAGIIKEGVSYAPGHLGCGMSHIELWRRCKAGDVPYFILEDDVRLRADVDAAFADLVKKAGEWDVFLLGFNLAGPMNYEMSPGVIASTRFAPSYPTPEQVAALIAARNEAAPFRLISAFGLCAYVITPEAAGRLLDICVPMDDRPVYVAPLATRRATAIDWLTNLVYPAIKAYVSLPPLAISPDDKSVSLTDKRSLLSHPGQG